MSKIDINYSDLHLDEVKDILYNLNNRVEELEKKSITNINFNNIENMIKIYRNDRPYLPRYDIDALFNILATNEEYINIDVLIRMIANGNHYKALTGRKVKVKLMDGLTLDFLILNEKYEMICITPIHSMEFSKSNFYMTSDVREWLNSDFIKLLPNKVISCLSKMEVESNKDILEDYVKIPSMTELGYSDIDYPIVNEGSVYNLLNISLFEDKFVWTRTSANHNNIDVLFINRFNVNCDSCFSKCLLTPIIRLRDN